MMLTDCVKVTKSEPKAVEDCELKYRSVSCMNRDGSVPAVSRNPIAASVSVNNVSASSGR